MLNVTIRKIMIKILFFHYIFEIPEILRSIHPKLNCYFIIIIVSFRSFIIVRVLIFLDPKLLKENLFFHFLNLKFICLHYQNIEID